VDPGSDLAVDEPDVGDARLAVGVGGMIGVARSGGPHGGDRHLGRPAHPGDHRLVEMVSGTADQRRWHRRTAADEHLQIGQVGAGSFGSSEQAGQERCGAAMWVQRCAVISETASSGSHCSMSTAVVPSSSGH
jgi:hypothetical protein